MLLVGCEDKSDPSEGRRPRVLFLCWERIAHAPAAQGLIESARWPFEVRPVETAETWRRSPFAAQVDQIDGLLEEHPIAVAHGYDAWVLMAAAEQRAARGAGLPYLLLINPVLGSSQHLNGALVGYRAPRGARVRCAFGLDAEEDGQRELIERTTFIFGDNDRYSAERDWRYLRGLGSAVYTIRGWHRRHWDAVEDQLRDVLAECADDLRERLDRASDADLAESATG